MVADVRRRNPSAMNTVKRALTTDARVVCVVFIGILLTTAACHTVLATEVPDEPVLFEILVEPTILLRPVLYENPDHN